MTAMRRVLIVLALALTVAPVVAFPLGAGRDYPNHLARIHIQANLGSAPLLDANYDTDWRLIPHSALDLVQWIAASGHTILAGQIFVAATLALILVGTIAIHRALFGRLSLWPLMGLFATFNLILEWGFVEYLFSIGLALNAFALWIASEHWSPRRRVPLFAALATAIFWSHVLGFLLYGLLITSFEAGRILDRSPRRWPDLLREGATNALQFVVPLALFAYVMATDDARNNGVTVAFGDLRQRIDGVLSPALYHDKFVALGVGVFFAAVLAVGWWTKTLEWDRRMRLPILALAVVSAVMPVSLLGIWGIQFRYPFVLMLVLIAAARVNAPAPALKRAFVAGFVAVLAVQQLNGWSEMYRVDDWHREVQTAVREMEPGSSLLTGSEVGAWPDIQHADAIAVIERSAFVTGLFTDYTRVEPSEIRRPLDGQGPPLSRAQLAEHATRPPPDGSDDAQSAWDGWPATFDYLLWIHGGTTDTPPAPGLRLVTSGSVVALYAIEPERAAASAP